MAAAYTARFPYSPETFDILAGLRRGDGPVCEIGAGNGRLTAGLARRVGRVDAVEPSAAMAATAPRALLGASDVRWLIAGFEEAALRGPYSLLVSSDAIHWLDWGIAFAKMARVLTPGGYLAIVGQEELEPGTEQLTRVRSPEVSALINEVSTNHEYERYDLAESLRAAGVFELVGSATGTRVTMTESIEQILTRLHSMNGLGPAALGRRRDAFDRRARELLLSLAPSGQVSTDVRTLVRWGYPRNE